jgi:predicted lipoprotein with Yx(FWY)xxD motif
MKGLLLPAAAFAAAFSLTVGLNSALATNQATAAGSKVGVASSSLGRILVDGRGRTLYLFAKDSRGKSSCRGQCAAFWPPLIASGKWLAVAGAKQSLLGTTKRADGRLQLTYNHHPLYTFVKDTAKGQTNGEEVDAFGAEWYAVSAAGKKIEKAVEAANGGAGATGADGYQSSPGYGY